MIVSNFSDRQVTLQDTAGNVYTVPAYSDTVLSDALLSDNTFRRWMRYRLLDIELISGGSVGGGSTTKAFSFFNG